MELIKNKITHDSLHTKKKLGAFYTPYELCLILTNWAIISHDDIILEPSFGQCSFLEASKNRLISLGSSSPKKQIYGCDIDENSFVFLAKVLDTPIDNEKFILKDFMDIIPNVHWDNNFNVSLGNPPYISGYNLTIDQKKDYAKRWKKMGVQLDGRASLWAHFLMHAISFIAPGGRIAWVLPGSFLQADYAVTIREYIGLTFSKTICILMEQRFFTQEGTEEETVILLAKNKKPQQKLQPICFANATDLLDLEKIINKWDKKRWAEKFVTARPSYLHADQNVLAIYEKILSSDLCLKLSNLMKINIGVVTGANSFFVIDDKMRRSLNIPEEELGFILSKIKFAKGLTFSLCDQQESILLNNRGYLIHIESFIEDSSIGRYLKSFPYEQIIANKTFKKRKIWHAPNDNLIPDAFLSVMNHHGPRMVLNDAKINCTNTIHRAYFSKDLTQTQKKLLAISMLTSFSQLSAEFTGRRYGSGVLKHEPTEMKKIAILFPQTIKQKTINTFFNKVDHALRMEDQLAAMKLADQLIIHPLENGKMVSDMLVQELNHIRTRRQRIKSTPIPNTRH